MSTITTLNDWITANSFRTQANTNFTNLNTDKQETSWKDTTGWYAGLTLFKINFKNVANTFTSFFTNSNTDSRTYTFQDRDGTIADNTDLATKAALAGSISQAFSVSQLEVGNASDTSITRSSAWVIAIEWVVVDTISAANTLTNKTMTGSTNTITARLLKSATTEIDVSSATAPTNGQVLTATSSTTATWQTPWSWADISCRIKQSSTQSIWTTLTAVLFDAETYDTDNMHSTSSNTSRITFNTDWKYHISWVFSTDANVGVWWWVRLNWSTYIFKAWVGNLAINTANWFTISFDYSFSASDYIELLGAFWSTQNTKTWEDGTLLCAFKF